MIRLSDIIRLPDIIGLSNIIGISDNWMLVAGAGNGGDCEAAWLDLRQYPGGSGRIRREGQWAGGAWSGLRVIRHYSGNFIIYSVGKKVRSLYRSFRDDK